MKSSAWSFVPIFGLSIANAAALPAAAAAPEPSAAPRGLKDTLGDLSVSSILSGVGGDIDDLIVAATAFGNVIKSATPTASPADIEGAAATLSSIFGAYATGDAVPNFLDSSLEIVTNGLSTKDLTNAIDTTIPSEPANSFNNTNSKEPVLPIYPRADFRDAPYDQPERLLRGAIFIPKTFTYGRSNAVPTILVPGTGVLGGTNFGSNFIKLLSDGSVADIVWLNIPGSALDDIQYNAEFVAYAINYISSITHKNVAVATWSQGSLMAGWALQYWPSTRGKVTDLINYSADYHGTVLAYLLNPKFPAIPSTPAVVQQEYNSTFINTFRSHGGASAYVPTTVIYSALLDEIVEPQQGPGASAFLLDDRNVGVTNNQIQTVCAAQPGGTLYTHEGVLYSSLAYALTIDALTHPGPGRVERLDLNKVCSSYAAPGLSLTDILATESTIPIAGFNIFLYHDKTFNEPPIRSYAK